MDISYVPAKTIVTKTKDSRWFPGEGLRERYLKTYGGRYECASPRAGELWRVFTEACRKYGILYEMKDIVHAYKRSYETTQLSLFDL